MYRHRIDHLNRRICNSVLMAIKENIIPLLTNAAYGLGALVIGVCGPGIWMGALMLGSGFHHWNLHTRTFDISKTVLADYLPMYGLLLSLIGYKLVPDASVIVGSLLFSVLIMLFVGESPTVIGVLAAALLLKVAIVAGLLKLMVVLFVAAVAMKSNQIGDTQWSLHNIEHGSWHIESAGLLVLIWYLL